MSRIYRMKKPSLTKKNSFLLILKILSILSILTNRICRA
jgi:hypothetical protein